MEISLIYRKLLSSALICPTACPLAAFSGWSYPSRHAEYGPRLPPHWAKASWDYWSVSDVSISLCHHNALFLFFLLFLSLALSSPLHNRVLGFLSHDGFIGGPLAEAFSLFFWSVQLGSLCCLAYQRRFVGHWAMDAEYKVISLPGSIKTTTTKNPSHHLPSSSFKWWEIVSLCYKCILKAFNF